jgi:hypothetical protein
MSSQTSERKWIVTTCRGRLQHLREALPSWLEKMPGWDPIVVCCDDPQATEYAAGELLLAHRGICLQLEQGQFFDRLEAIRAGIKVVAAGFNPQGQTISAASIRNTAGARMIGEWDMVALLDADTIATGKTQAAFDEIDPLSAAVAGSGGRDDVGVLVVGAEVLVDALKLLPVGSFEGYGLEDCAIRVACWACLKEPFERLPFAWLRRQHTEHSRVAHHSRGMRWAVARNRVSMGELMARIIAPEELARCRAECLGWPARFGAADGGTHPNC